MGWDGMGGGGWRLGLDVEVVFVVGGGEGGGFWLIDERAVALCLLVHD
jgi:hypothetical protein